MMGGSVFPAGADGDQDPFRIRAAGCVIGQRSGWLAVMGGRVLSIMRPAAIRPAVSISFYLLNHKGRVL